MRMILNIVGLAFAIAAALCILITCWDQILQALERLKSARAECSEYDDYEDIEA